MSNGFHNRSRWEGAFYLALSLALLSLMTCRVESAEPNPQVTLPCRVTEVYDGDTVTVEITLPIRVRLLDCWAPEIRTTDPVEKQAGFKSRDHLSKLAEGKTGTLMIPLAGADRFDDVITLGRVLGYIWVDGKDISAEQRKAGHATKEKQ